MDSMEETKERKPVMGRHYKLDQNRKNAVIYQRLKDAGIIKQHLATKMGITVRALDIQFEKDLPQVELDRINGFIDELSGKPAGDAGADPDRKPSPPDEFPEPWFDQLEEKPEQKSVKKSKKSKKLTKAEIEAQRKALEDERDALLKEVALMKDQIQRMEGVTDNLKKKMALMAKLERSFGFAPADCGKWRSPRMKECPNCGKNPTLQYSKYVPDTWLVLCDECFTRAIDETSPIRAVKAWNEDKQTENSLMIHQPLIELDSTTSGAKESRAAIWYKLAEGKVTNHPPEPEAEKKKPKRKPAKYYGQLKEKKKILEAEEAKKAEGGAVNESEGSRPAGSESA